MADKSVFSIPLDDLTSFTQAAQDAKKIVDGIAGAWKQAAQSIKEAREAAQGTNQAISGMTSGMRSLNNAVREYATSVQTALGYWRQSAAQTGQIAANITRAATAVRQMRAAAGGGAGGGGGPTPPTLPPPSQPPGTPPNFNLGSSLTSISGSMSHAASAMSHIGKTLTQSIMGTGGPVTGLAGNTATGLSAAFKSGPIGMALAAMGLLGGGMIAAPFMAAPGVADLRKRSLGLSGVGINELRAAGVAGSWMNNAEGVLGGLATARRDITSDQRVAMQNLFGANTDKELGQSRTQPGKTMFDALDEATKQLEKYDESVRDTMAETLGYTGLLGEGNLRAYQLMSEPERAQHRASWEKVAEQTKTTPEQDRAWFDFYDKMRQTGAVMELNIIKKLAPLQGPLERLMDEFTKFTDSKFFDDLITQFANFIDSWKEEDLQKLVKELGDVMRQLWTGLKALADAIKWVADKFPKTSAVDVQHNLDLGRDRFGYEIKPDGSSENFRKPGEALADSKSYIDAATPEEKAAIDAAKKAKIVPDKGVTNWLDQHFGTGWKDWFGGGDDLNGQPKLDFNAQPDNPALKAWRERNMPTSDQTPRSGEVQGDGAFVLPGSGDKVSEDSLKEQKKTNDLLDEIKANLDKAGEFNEGTGFGAGGGGGTSGAGAGPGRAAGGKPGYAPGGTGSESDILAQIRSRESKGNYKLRPEDNYAYPKSHASGAYQIQPATWKAWTAGSGIGTEFSEAYLAPPEIQDQVAAWALRKYGANATGTWAASAPPGGYPTLGQGGGAYTGPGGGGSAAGGLGMKGVDPRIAEIISAASRALPPGYTVRATSGKREQGYGFHPKGMAEDFQIFDPSGKPVSNRGEDASGMYTALARNAYGYQEKFHPELTGQFQWGGAFGTVPGGSTPDLMHFDLGGRRGNISRYQRDAIGAALPPGEGKRRSAKRSGMKPHVCCAVPAVGIRPSLTR